MSILKSKFFIQLEKWYFFTLSQLKNDEGKFIFRVEVDGNLYGEIENTQPETFENVKVWASDPHTNYAGARIDKFRMVSFDKGNVYDLKLKLAPKTPGIFHRD